MFFHQARSLLEIKKKKKRPTHAVCSSASNQILTGHFTGLNNGGMPQLFCILHLDFTAQSEKRKRKVKVVFVLCLFYQWCIRNNERI